MCWLRRVLNEREQVKSIGQELVMLVEAPAAPHLARLVTCSRVTYVFSYNVQRYYDAAVQIHTCTQVSQH